MAGHAVGQRQTTYLIMFSLFLKLLGFFIVLYSYADIQPNKAQAVEQSLQQRFNINISLPELSVRSGVDKVSPWAVQNTGRSFDAIATELKTQMDSLSTEYDARRGTLTLTVPAQYVLPLNGNSAKSPEFARMLVETLRKNAPDKGVYLMQIVAGGPGREGEVMMRGIGDFVQSVVARDYSPEYLTIGYENADTPQVKFIIRGAPK